MLTVASVFWKGKFRGREKIYEPYWVRILRNMVERNLTISHRFVCLSNVDIEGIERIPLVHDWPGWWSKIELFRPSNGLAGRVLYIDIDMLILSSLNEIANYPAQFATWPGVPKEGYGKRRRGREGKLLVDGCKTALMVWTVCRELHRIYNEFDYSSVARTYRGDQDWISDIVPNMITPLPSKWVCKLRDYIAKGKPKDVKVLGGLGGPNGKNAKAAEKFRWIREIWN